MNISDSALLWIIFENGILTFRFMSQEFITVEIFEIYFTTTEIWQHLSKKSWNVRKKIQTQFFGNFSCLYSQIAMSNEDSTIKWI